jgi:hypothetical protein
MLLFHNTDVVVSAQLFRWISCFKPGHSWGEPPEAGGGVDLVHLAALLATPWPWEQSRTRHTSIAARAITQVPIADRCHRSGITQARYAPSRHLELYPCVKSECTLEVEGGRDR